MAIKYRVTETSTDDRAHFRCPVVGDKGKASLCIGFTSMNGTVLEAAVDAYTVAVSAKYVKKLQRSADKDWIMHYDDTRALVRFETISPPQHGMVRVGLRQVHDLTKPERIKSAFWSRFMPTLGDSSTASVAYGGFVLLLFAAMAMPGLGDKLGTSQRIQKTFRWVMSTATTQADMWTH